MPENTAIPIRRALLSVSDKEGLVPFAAALAKRGITILSTGGTAKTLKQEGIPVTLVESVTGFPEGLDGRVKTLHPKVHGGILAKYNNPQHDDFCKTHDIQHIDLVCINLYPFEKVTQSPDTAYEKAVENIDIGGPAMVRAAAKNHERVAVLTAPNQYNQLLEELNQHNGSTTLNLRKTLAAAAFKRTAQYDAIITDYLTNQLSQTATPQQHQQPDFPEHLTITCTKVEDLRYGENPHQPAALYKSSPPHTGPSVVTADRLHGKALSYNNINDAAGALDAVLALHRLNPNLAAACVVKHAAPCGLATSTTTQNAAQLAIAGDPLAAYGGIFATNKPINTQTAQVLAHESRYFEVIVAPHFEDEALDILKSRSANLRLLATGPLSRPTSTTNTHNLQLRSIPGGLLIQQPDLTDTAPPNNSSQPHTNWTHAAGPPPTEAQLATAALLEVAAAMLMSNAVAIGAPAQQNQSINNTNSNTDVMLLGTGGGQPDRVWASRLAAERTKSTHPQHLENHTAVAFSDAFFPFPDGPKILIDAGVRCIIHPGGSKRDNETFQLCNDTNTTCITTGKRHFRH